MAKLNILLVGAGRVAEFLLLSGVLREISEELIIIERDQQRLDFLQRIAPYAMFIQGDATNIDTFSNIDMSRINVVLALTDSDDINLFILSIAKSYNIPIRIGRFTNPKVAELVEKLQLGIAIVQPMVVANFIEHLLTSITSTRELSAIDSNLRLFIVSIAETDPVVGSRIEDTRLSNYGAKIVLLFEGSRLRTPSPDDVLKSGYILFVLSSSDEFIRSIKG
ncbi:NAD-binding protein [Thermogladius sp. 4427co]|uniref:NAD-binding protein n=1 Tax=Thermogladius sp. 4427co TaxID=3450718 RepID=UPI003F7A8E2B